MRTSCSEEQSRKASLPMRRNLRGKHICSKCEQCEKVDPHMVVISVPKRSTLCNLLQFSHAIGPTKLKSAGNSKCSMPDPQKLPSGIYRVQGLCLLETDLPECSCQGQMSSPGFVGAASGKGARGQADPWMDYRVRNARQVGAQQVGQAYAVPVPPSPGSSAHSGTPAHAPHMQAHMPVQQPLGYGNGNGRNSVTVGPLLQVQQLLQSLNARELQSVFQLTQRQLQSGSGQFVPERLGQAQEETFASGFVPDERRLQLPGPGMVHGGRGSNEKDVFSKTEKWLGQPRFQTMGLGNIEKMKCWDGNSTWLNSWLGAAKAVRCSVGKSSRLVGGVPQLLGGP